jgi:hypothetical protein
MKKFEQNRFSRLLSQYKGLSDERLAMENEILKLYDSLTIDNVVTITSDKLEKIKSLRGRLDIVNREIKKTDKKILKILIP